MLNKQSIKITIRESVADQPVTGLTIDDIIEFIGKRVVAMDEIKPGVYLPIYDESNINIMQNHTKNYFKAFKIDYNESGWHDFIACEMCGNEAVDLHHIENRIKGVKRLNHHKNIIALCRSCHEKAHANKYGYTKDCLMTKHENNMRINKIDF